MTSSSDSIRIGHGYDIHRLVTGRDLWLGGIKIPCEVGLEGHSDADVALHALCDSLLGAAALKDIGFYFPPSDNQYKGISSLILLSKVKDLINQKGYQVSNVDLSIVAEKPRLAAYIDAMKIKISESLQITTEQVGIKVTTNEGVDQIGRGEAICAYAVSLLLFRGAEK